MSKVILITGTSTGLDVSIAVQAAAAGHTVYASMRDLDKRAALEDAAMASYITPTFGINFTTVEPGGIRTEFVANVMKQIAATGGLRDDEYAPVLQRYISGSASRQDSGAHQTPDEVAAVVMQVVEAPDPPIRIRTSPWREALCQLKTGADPDGKRCKRRWSGDSSDRRALFAPRLFSFSSPEGDAQQGR